MFSVNGCASDWLPTGDGRNGYADIVSDFIVSALPGIMGDAFQADGH